MKKIFIFILGISLIFSNGVYAIEQDEDNPLQYSVSDDENFIDGVMSNPDGYEGSGYEVVDGQREIINQSLLRGSGYDLTWGYENGKKVMYDGDGIRFGYGECKKVIDVSSYNGNINWSAVKNGGVDGAILRITSFSGGYMHEDDKFASNLSGCRNTQMPFGIYMYSYATDTNKAANEANYVVQLLRKYGVRPSELVYPVYYDLEGNSSTSGLSVEQNAANVETFVSILSANGYPVNVYSYTSYFNNNLNSPRIHKYASWVAQYGKKLTFKNNYYTGNYGWQYRSNGRVAGVNGDVDVSCFSNFYGYDSDNHTNQPLGRDTTTPTIEYCANSQNVGWLPYFMEPNTAGTTGRSLPLYQLKLKLNNVPKSTHLFGTVKTASSTVEYSNIEEDTVVGTNGKAMRQVKFDLDNVPGYHLEYRVHSADIGWQSWVKEGNYAGNQSKDIQAIDFRLVADSSVRVEYPQIYYRSHIADVGWLNYVPDSQVSGAANNGVFLQAINIGIDGDDPYKLNGSVFVEGKNWINYDAISSNTVLGTTGQSKAIKAVKFNLELDSYDLQYMVYIANKGWQNWTNNNEVAGDTINNIEKIKFRLVYDNGVINKITLDKKELTLNLNEKDKLSAVIRPSGTTMDKTLTWRSSDANVVSVDNNGNLVAKKVGNATITVTTVNGLSSSCTVKVIKPIDKIVINEPDSTLEKGTTKTFSVQIHPEDTTEDKTIIWSTANSKVATVDQNGKVTAIDAGTTELIAKTSNGLVAKCKISVTSKILSVSLNKTTLKLEETHFETLKATINPSNTTDSKELTWLSSNSSVASVDSSGKVTAKAKGTATITVKTSNGKTASCDVTVVEQTPSVTYQTHIQDIGWQSNKTDGQTSGTTAQSKRLEAIKINLTNNSAYSGNIQYQTHIQDIGWQDWKSNGAMSGTSGQSKRLEAIKVRLTGEMADKYDIYYRVHAQNFGWLDWAKNGESAGTAGYSYRLEAIEIKLVEKGKAAPGNTKTPFVQRYIKYSTHIQDVGWQTSKVDGQTSGTVGQSKRLEAIKINLENPLYSGSVEYSAHIQDIGWQGKRSNGAISGTSGQSKRLEAVKINLTGEMANHYDIYYRVHAQNFGWLGWAKNGAPAGTEGYSYRLEAIEIVLVEKGGKAPGSTSNQFNKK